MAGIPEEHGMWLSILQWSLRQSDGTTGSSARVLSEEDKEFLRNVMKDMTRDEPKRMSEILKSLQEALEPSNESLDEETLINLLEDLRDIVEQIDMAHVLVKYGGIEILYEIIKTEKSLITYELKGLAASTIGTISQNHPAVQDILYNKGLLHKLCDVIASQRDLSAGLVSKITYAISSLIRGHAPLEKLFIENYMVPLSSHILSSYSTDVATIKRLFFLFLALVSTETAATSLMALPLTSSPITIAVNTEMNTPIVVSQLPSFSSGVVANENGSQIAVTSESTSSRSSTALVLVPSTTAADGSSSTIATDNTSTVTAVPLDSEEFPVSMGDSPILAYTATTTTTTAESVGIAHSLIDSVIPILIPCIFQYITNEDIDLRDLTVRLLEVLYSYKASNHSPQADIAHGEILYNRTISCTATNTLSDALPLLIDKLAQRESMTTPFDLSEEQNEVEKTSIRYLKEKLLA